MTRAALTNELLSLGNTLATLVLSRGEGPVATAEEYQRQYVAVTTPFQNRLPLPPADHARLTERERACVELASQGMRDLAIGGRLGISAGTVKVHLKNARQKAGL